MDKADHGTDCIHCANRLSSVFCNVNDKELEALGAFKSCMTYKKGQILFSEGGYPLGIYCINTGKIKVSRNGDDGRESIIRLAKPGDVIGYKSILGGEKYSASAIALEDSQICFIPKDIFINLVKVNSNLSLELLKRISAQLRSAEVKISHLAQKPVRERLAETILFIKETYGFEDDGQTLNVVLSREEIANLVGTATESAIRLLSEFKKDRMIELSGKKIIITDLQKLLKTANLQD